MTTRRLRWGTVAVVLLILGVAGATGLYLQADALVERHVRPALIDLLESRFDSRVELGSLRVTVAPRLSIRAENITMRHHGRTDIPPLVTMRGLAITARPRDLWARRLDRVHIEGLEFIIPPRRGADMPDFAGRAAGDGRGEVPDVYIGEIVAEDSWLSIMPARAGKSPRVFQIRRLRFEHFRFDQPAAFEAAITNPTPHGEIAALGRFGPWEAGEPSLTPVDGSFLFDADLGTIRGLGGRLHAEGEFAGPLASLRTRGRTRTEGFHLSRGGARFPLAVDYDAVVDATSGDLVLERVEGMLGATRIEARGSIVRVEGRGGRRITLDTRTRRGRLDDLIKLTTRVQASPMSGLVDAEARLVLPPGPGDVLDRLDLEGTFRVARVRFTADHIQARIDELARRGSGRPADTSLEDVASNLRGAFRLHDGRLSLRALTFAVEGAAVRLAGVYDIRREVLDFRGELRLKARASQTQTGWRRFVLKLFDPLLDGPGAGTVLPISITGTREHPKFAANIKQAIFR